MEGKIVDGSNTTPVGKSDRDLSPSEIEEKSFRILDGLMGDLPAHADVCRVIKRVAHATADVEWARTLRFSPRAVEAGVEAVVKGAPIITDVEMVRAGVRRSASDARGHLHSASGDAVEVLCFLNDPEVVSEARRSGTTRARAAMRRALPLLDGAIVAIGNAPTALFEVCDLIRAGACRPALVVGLPIGFVGAAESHDELASLGCEWITAPGAKGGSAAAAAAVNAILRLACAKSGGQSVKGGRVGRSTGSCAAAAATGAALLLLRGERPESVEIPLPSDGESLLCVPIESCKLTPGGAICSVRKDAGDDPDVTDGMLFDAEVSLTDEPGIKIIGGIGIGRVTRKGLPVPPGEWAINPVPRMMISDSLAPLIPPGRGLRVTISAPEGKKRAERTWNPRVGVEGGVSILGTSGLVIPKSTPAYLASLNLYISSALAFDSPRPGTLFLVPGYVGERALLEGYSVPPELIVRTGDHFGHALSKSAELGARRLFLFGHVGKWAKVAAGLFNTHCDFGDARLETLAACAGACGATPGQMQELLALPLAEEAIPLIRSWGLERAFSFIAERMHRRCSLYVRSGGHLPIETGVALLSIGGEVIGSYPALCSSDGREIRSWLELPSSV